MKKLISPLGEAGWFDNTTDGLYNFITETISTKTPTNTRAVVAPHAGYKWCGDVFGSVMQHVDDRYTRVIIIGPSHRTRFKNKLVCCDYDCISTPLGDCEVFKITGDYVVIDNNTHHQEHSVQMHVPYVQYCCPSAHVIPIIISEFDSNNLKAIVDYLSTLLNDQTLVMISSDFTHYGPRFNYQPYKNNIKQSIENYDKSVIEHVLNNDIKSFERNIQQHNTICGRNAIRLLLHMFEEQQFSAKLCKYSTSGDITKDYTNTVSYAGIHIS